MTMGTIRWTTAAALLVASVAGAQLDPERNHLACYPVKGKAIKRSVTLDNALGSGPQAALTGPIARGDAATVAAHREALRNVDPTVAKLYEAAAGHLLELAKQRGLSDASVRALQEVLE